MLHTETELLATVRALLAEGYRISQEGALGGVYAFALLFRPADGSSVYLSWEA